MSILLKFVTRSLHAKIIAWSFVPTMIILCAVALVNFYSYQRVTEDLVLGRSQELTRLSGGQLGGDLLQHADVLASLARTADIYGSSPAMQQAALTRAANRLVVFDAGVLLINRYGTVVAAEPRRPDAVDHNWANRPYYQQMLRSGSVVFSDVVADGPSGSNVIVVAVPITDDQSEFQGTLAGMFRVRASSVSSFYGGIVKLRIGENATTYMVDSAGKVIYHTDPERIGSDASNNPVVKQLLGRKASQVNRIDQDGRSVVASTAPVPGTPWVLVTEESWDSLMGSSRGYQQFLLLLLALGVAVPALVVTLGVRHITGPIAALIRASQEVASGNFGRTIDVRTGDELEELAGQFNTMSAELRESYANLEKKVEARTKELATLNAVSEVVSRSLDLNEILNSALDRTLQAMGIEEGGVYLLDEKTGDLVLAVSRGMRPEIHEVIRRLAPGEGYSGLAAERGEMLVVEDISEDPRIRDLRPPGEGRVALASVPLSARGKVLGTLFATSAARPEFAPQDLQLLTSIAHQVAVAIENARLFASEQRRAEQFRLINEVGRTITSILSVDDLAREIVQLVHEVLGYRVALIGLVEGDELVFKSGAGDWPEGSARPALRLKIGGPGITAWVAQTGEPAIVADVSSDPRYLHGTSDSSTASELTVPLKGRESVIGVLDVGSEKRDAFDESDLVVLQSLAYQAAVAIENARLYEQAKQLAVMEERNRLARDLHDSVTQAVYSVTLYAEASNRLLSSGDSETAAEHLRELRATAQQALREMRCLIFELRPPVLEKEGLVAALQARLESVEGRAGVATDFKVDGCAELSDELEGALYRIAQEALNNALKHSQARGVKLYLRRDEQVVVLEISDDGAGFDPGTGHEHGGLGLKGIEERAAGIGGKLTVRSSPGEGTTIRVEVAR